MRQEIVKFSFDGIISFTSLRLVNIYKNANKMFLKKILNSQLR